MKIRNCLSVVFVFLIIISCNDQTIEPNRNDIVNIPDNQFKSKIINAGYDLNNDGEISYVEAEIIDTLNVAYYDPLGLEAKINSLTGIETFTNLKFLNFYDNNISGDLDFSKNRKLEYINCGLNRSVTSLNLQNLTELKELNVFFNNISELDLSTNKKLYKLKISMSQLQYIDISKNKQLEIFESFGCPIKNMTLSSSLRKLIIGGTSINIDYLDILDCKNLEFLSLSYFELPLLDISQNTKLSTLSIGFINNLETICVWQLPLPDTLEINLTNVNPEFKVCE